MGTTSVRRMRKRTAPGFRIDPDKIYSLRDAMRVLRLSEPTVYKLITEGKLRPRKVGPRLNYFTGRDLLALFGVESAEEPAA